MGVSEDQPEEARPLLPGRSDPTAVASLLPRDGFGLLFTDTLWVALWLQMTFYLRWCVGEMALFSQSTADSELVRTSVSLFYLYFASLMVVSLIYFVAPSLFRHWSNSRRAGEPDRRCLCLSASHQTLHRAYTGFTVVLLGCMLYMILTCYVKGWT